MLRYNELRMRGVVDVDGDIMMDAPAHSNNDQLIGLAGGSGSEEEREAARKTWKEWCSRRLSDADKDRRKKRYKPKAEDAVKANDAAGTAAALGAVVHRYRIYSDGGTDGNGAGRVWGDSGYGVVIFEVREDGSVVEIATVYGPVVVDATSEWSLGAVRGTNQTGELCGCINALLWLEEYGEDGDVAICVDSLYAGNEIEGCWAVKANHQLIRYGQEVLKKVRKTRSVTFIHVKGHSSDGENDRADELVQWGKSDGPFTRLGQGISEGPGLTGPVTDGPVRKTAVQSPGEVTDEADNDDGMLRELLANLPADFLEWDDEEEDEVPENCKVRDPAEDSRHSLVDALFSMSSEEENEGMEDGGVEDAGATEEGGEEISEVTAAVGSLRITERELDRRYFTVCDNLRSFVISVQGGS